MLDAPSIKNPLPLASCSGPTDGSGTAWRIMSSSLLISWLSMSSAMSLCEIAFELNCTQGVAYRRSSESVFFFDESACAFRAPKRVCGAVDATVASSANRALPEGEWNLWIFTGGSCSAPASAVSREAELLPCMQIVAEEWSSCVSPSMSSAVTDGTKPRLPPWLRTEGSNEDDATLRWQSDLLSRNTHGLGRDGCVYCCATFEVATGKNTV